jgi:hypothetical protein
MISKYKHRVEYQMQELFNRLPFELKRYEIRSHLDQVSLFLLQNGLLQKELPSKLSHSQELTAIQHGLPVVKFLLDKEHLSLSTLTPLAAQAGNLEVLKWSIQQNEIGTDPTERTLELASMYGHLDIFIWLAKKGIHVNQQAVQLAGISGSIVLVTILLELGCE